MATEAMGRLYDQFTPAERMTLMLEAMARSDDAEIEKLRCSCPQKQYVGTDRAFTDRMERAFEIMTVACVDLRGMCAKLHVLDYLIEIVPLMAGRHRLNAMMAFLEGIRYAEGGSSLTCFAGPEEAKDSEAHELGGQGEAAVDAVAKQLEEEEEESDPEEVDPEFMKRLEGIERQADRATVFIESIHRHTAEVVAQHFVNVWEALAGFCRTCLGVEAMALLRAWEFPPAEEFAGVLKRYGHLIAEPEHVAEYQECLCGAWERSFGGT